MGKQQHGATTQGFSVLASFLISVFVIAISADTNGDTLLSIKDSWRATLPTWTAGTTFCKWEGVTCNSQGTDVIALNLANKGLMGDMPSAIGNLVSLISLDISYTNLSSGPQNRVTGDLSPLGSLTNLQFLNASFNNLNTNFPSSVLRLTNLINLHLDNTNLTGSLPEGLSSLTKLQHLSLWKNPFSSKIPVGISNLVNLEFLYLHNCNLWGGLPPEFSKLEKLKILHLYTNLLTGPIPSTWQSMQALEELRLEYNFLTLAFPSWTLNESNLTNLSLLNNQLYGPLPNFSSIPFGTMDLSCNFFSGPWPTIGSNASISFDRNCFSNVSSENDTSKDDCKRMYSCNGFSQNIESSCPPCPTPQVRLNATLCICGEESEPTPKNSNLAVILGTVLPVVVFLFVALIILFIWKSRRKSKLSKYGDLFSVKATNSNWDVPEGVHRFSIEELAKVTDGFNKSREIGSGGFGRVYYGVLQNGKKVAIKRASSTSMQGGTEFRNEITLLSRLHHRNLVRLEGFCEDAGLQILVYEFVTNGNLHAWLFGTNNKSGSPFDWYRRLDVALGVAQGLDYLHSFADPPVIHRDVKPSNILLDEHLVAKLSDFGLSKSNPLFQTHLSTTPAGTAGFMDPQYFLRQQLTTASDVYGFGVVLLELITGQKAIDNSRLDEINLIEWARPRLQKEGIHGIIDPRIGTDFPEKLYYELAELAIKCSSFNTADRPSMQDAVVVLETMLRSVNPPLYSTHWRNQDKSHSGKTQSETTDLNSGSTVSQSGKALDDSQSSEIGSGIIIDGPSSFLR